jgi:hypothetical protein
MPDLTWIHHRARVLLILAGLVLALGPALAADPVRVDASAMAFDDDDDPIEEAGVDFALDGGLVLVLSDEDTGYLGNAVVPPYPVALLPEDALDRVLADEALRRMELVTWVPGGITIVFDDISRERLIETTMARLAEIGCDVDAREPGKHEFTFRHGDQEYRAVFGTVAEGARMFLGH